ncbi:MAG: hypothetical protein ACXADL_05985 [Candidatus Thorarchaeota archaeon]|jgi:hypothetical protein
MIYDEEDFEDDYDEDEEDTFPDEEEETEVELVDERSYSVPSETVSFIDNPWPTVTLVLILIGLGFTLLTPPAIWSDWVYFLVVNYLLIVMAGAGAAYSVKVWKTASGSRLKYGGITNLIVVIAAAIIGTLDTISWMLNGASIVAGVNTPILALATVIVLFSLYSLWLIQRTFQKDK